MARVLLSLALLLWPVAAAPASAVVIGFDAESVTGAWNGPGAEGGFAYSRLAGGLWLQAIDSASTGGNPVPHMEGLLGAGGGTLRIVRTGGGGFLFDGADVAQVFLKSGAARSVTFQGLLDGRTVGTDLFATAAVSNAWVSHASVALAGLVIDELRIILDTAQASVTEAVDNIALTVVDSVVGRDPAGPVAVARAGR